MVCLIHLVLGFSTKSYFFYGKYSTRNVQYTYLKLGSKIRHFYGRFGGQKSRVGRCNVMPVVLHNKGGEFAQKKNFRKRLTQMKINRDFIKIIYCPHLYVPYAAIGLIAKIQSIKLIRLSSNCNE